MSEHTYFKKIFVMGTLFLSLCFCCVIGSAQTVRYVKNGGTSSSGAGAATSWSAACSDLQAVVNISSAGDTVFVMAGNYPGRFTMKEGIQVYGGFAGTESYTTQRTYAINNTVATTSVLDGENTGRVLTQLTPYTLPTVWDGFVLKNGNAVISEMEVGSVIFGKAGTEFYNVPAGIFFWYNSSINTGFMMGLNSNDLIQAPDNSDIIGIPNLDYNEAIVDYNGLAYTNVLAALYPTENYAANWAVSLTDGGYTDWHIPSMGELAELCTYKTPINSVLTLLGKPTLTNSVRNSCSETSASTAPPNFAVSLGMYPCAGPNVAKTKSSSSPYHPYHYISPSDLDNLAFCGGGALIQENGILRRCIVEDSKASYKGGGVYIETGGRVEGCLVHSNQSPSGFGVYTNGGVITSSTIADNQEVALPDGATLPVETAGLAVSSSTVNNIISSLNTDMALASANCNSTLNADSYVGDTPGFTAVGNYLLANNSSLRGAGNASLVPAELLLDLDLNPRITAYNTIDPGAYQTEGIRGPLHFYVTVEANPAGDGSGSDWDNSMSNLSFSYRLKTSQPGDTFYVAAGTYYPQLDSSGTVPSSPKNGTYKPNHGVTVIGSYKTGLTGTANDLVNDRILTDASGELAPTTIFSGDIDGDGVTDDPDDVYIVIWAEHNTTGDPVSLNGIEVSHAYAGGIILRNTDIILDYCKITKNRGMNYSFVGGFIGGIIYSQAGNCIIRNSSIMENNLEGGLAESDGVVDVVNGDLSIYNSVIGKNISGFVSAVSFSGTAANTLKIYNSTISDNQTYDTELGTIYIANRGSTVDIRNATIVDNTCMYDASGSGIVILNKSMGPSSPVFIGPGTFKMINTILSGSTGSDIILLEQTYFGPGAPFEPNTTYMGGAIYQTTEYSANPPVHSIIATQFYNGGATGTPVAFNTTPSYLSALSYNGGFTQTRALTGADNYALVNGFPDYSGSSGAPEGLSLDQRLVTRKDPSPSIGAFEYRAPQTGFYVTVDANPTGDGSGIDWDNSMSNLSFSQKLLTAQPGDTFYVAGGVYYPQIDASGNENPTNVKNKTYILKPGVSIIGSYKTDLTGTANDLTDDRILVDASRELTPSTVFSGDLDGSGTLNSNDISIMMGAYNNGTESAPVYLNGFEVTYAYFGGIYASNTNLEIDFCKIDSVRGSTGLNVGDTDIGGVLVSLNGNCTVRNSAILNNIHQGGGSNFGIVKMYNGNLHIYNSVIAKNRATSNSASAIYFVNGTDHTLGIYNSTITDNTTSGSFGAVFIARGALAVEIINSTIVDNMALNTNITAGITIENGMNDDWSGFDFKGPAAFRLDNTIVSGNTNANIVLLNWNLFGGYAPAGTDGGIYLFQNPNNSTFPYQNNPAKYTLIGSDFYNGISGIPVTFNTTPAYLAPLAYNGGFTRTRALLGCDNYAIDHGNPDYIGTAVLANNLNKDQRGILRREPAPSIGAYDIGEGNLTTGTIQIVAQPSCAGNNGEIRIAVTGGSGSYQYSTDNTTFTDLASDGIIRDLAPGTYRFYIQDKIQVICGTYISEVITLEATDHTMNFRIVVQDASSCGINDGKLQLFITGGTPTYQYQLDGGGWTTFTSGEYIENVTPGIHVINVMDVNGTGCLVSSGEVVVNAADGGINVAVSDVQNTTCSNHDGAFTLTVSGGTTPYTYQIDGKEMIELTGNIITVEELAAGNHAWKIVDASGCSSKGNQEITNGTGELAASVVSTVEADCSGINGGSITLDVTGGDGNYEFSINGKDFTPLPADGIIPDLAIGNYDIIIKDGTNCTFEYQNIEINKNSGIHTGTIYIVSQPSCSENNGEVSLVVTGGSGSYQYSTDNVIFRDLPVNGRIQNLAPGAYRFYIKDKLQTNCPTVISDAITLEATGHGMNFQVAVQNASSCGMSNGQLQLLISGGTPGYQYQFDGGAWTTFASGDYIGNVYPGIHVVNVRDHSGTGCLVSSGEVMVDVTGGGLAVDVSNINNTTCGNTNGAFTLTMIAGLSTAPYQYQIDGGQWLTMDDNIIHVTNLGAGSHSWKVTDATGCYAQGSQLITNGMTGVLASIASTIEADCSGIGGGSITLNVSGGDGNYEYSINGRDFTGLPADGVIPNLAIGTYDIVIKDGTGCTFEYQNIKINQNSGMYAGTIQIVAQPSCSVNNGQVRLAVTGGSGSYQYSTDNVAFTDLPSNGLIQNLAAGTYRFYIKDKLQTNCPVVISDAITLEATDHGMNFQLVAQNASSCGVNDGQLQLFISGGTPTYQYQLDGGSWATFVSGDYIEHVTSGIHVVNVRDDNGTGCSVSSGEVRVNAFNGGLAVNVSNINNTICGNTNGAFTLTITGGAAPYQYQINGGQLLTTNDNVIHVANLGAGSHSWRVTDATGCYAEGSQLLHNGPDALLVSLASTIDADCSGTGGGSITLNILMGGGNYEYSINGRDFTALPADGVIGNLAIGTYDIVIKDGTGCTFEYQNIKINKNSGMYTGTIQIVAQPSCSVNNGQVRLAVTGGSGSYQYSTDNVGFTDLPANGLIQNLAAGTYRFYIKDKLHTNCPVVISDAITLEATDHGMNFQLVAQNASSCGVNDGKLQLFISGGTPTYQYQLDGGSWATFVSGDYIENITSGIHLVNVKDNNGTGCLVSSAEVMVNAADGGLTVKTSDIHNTTCGNTDGVFTLTIAGGSAPYQYQINGGQLITTTETSIHVTNLVAGSHSWRIIDATGCYAEGSQLIINDGGGVLVSVISTLDADCSGTGGGSITLNVSGGDGNYEYSINGRNFTGLPADGVIPDLAVGTYDIVIRDGTGCTFEYQNIRIEDRHTAVVSIGTIFLAKQPTCNNADGEIQVYVTGISGSYKYRIGETGNYETLPANGLITGFSAGSYRIYVIDDAYASCPAAVSDVITLTADNSTLNFVTKASDATGCGTAGGSITLMINGGVAPYEYSLDGGEWTTFTTGKVLPDLTPGTYVINVKDMAGCAAGSGEVIVGAGNNGLQVTATDIIPTDCEESKGSFTLVAPNGTAPYRYQLNGGDWITSPGNIMTIDRLAAGNYAWRVEDNTGCYKQDRTIIHNNTSNPLSVTVTTTPANCSGLADGSITLTITGGTGNYQYSFDGGVSWEPVTGNKTVLENRAAGIYDLMIKDGSNCIYKYQNATIDIGVSLKLTAFLEGPINGVLMTNYLQEPDYSFENSMLTEPRHPVLNPYGIAGVYHSNIHTAACHAGQVVDWIKVEIRKVNDPKTILQEKALLLKPDGSIIDTNGRTPVFNVQTEPVHIVVSHRNHLSIVTPVLPQFSMLKGCHSYDFSTSLSQAFKFDPADPDPMVESPVGSGIWCMWAGDTNWDEIIENEDDRNVNEDSKSGLFDAYLTTDLNHDGITENRDDIKVRINSTLGIYSPLFWWILMY